MTDLLSLVLELKPKYPNQVQNKSWYGWAAQSILLRSVRQAFSSQFSHAMHLDNLRRAYTASSLYSDLELGPALSRERRYFLRYTALNEENARALVSTTLPGQLLSPGSQVNLSGLRMKIVGTYMQGLQHALAQTNSYESLWDVTVKAAASLPERISLHLGSATFFKSTATGRFQYELTPPLVFGSLFERWKRFASLQIPETGLIEYINQSVRVCDQSLDMSHVDGRFKRQGVVGTITYCTTDPHSQYWVFAHILARYALFAGVGKETASGFGQCWLL